MKKVVDKMRGMLYTIKVGYLWPTRYGPVVQLVRTPACHAGGREFESRLGRSFKKEGGKHPRILGA